MPHWSVTGVILAFQRKRTEQLPHVWTVMGFFCLLNRGDVWKSTAVKLETTSLICPDQADVGSGSNMMTHKWACRDTAETYESNMRDTCLGQWSRKPWATAWLYPLCGSQKKCLKFFRDFLRIWSIWRGQQTFLAGEFHATLDLFLQINLLWCRGSGVSAGY